MGLVWAACFVLFVLAYFFVISPRLEVKARLVKESAVKERMYEAAVDAAKEENKKKLAEEVEGLKSKLNDYVSGFEESANLTFDISRIAADKQVSSFKVKATDQLRESGPLESKYLQENRVEAAFESDFTQFATFLNALERHRPVVFVDRFRISRGGRNENLDTVDMGISIFVRKRPEG
jgi:Tfp pilus assembly protein PilO